MFVCTDAGILGEIATRANRQVQSKFFDNRFGLRSGFDLDDYRKVIALGDGLLGDERVTGSCKRHLDWGRAHAGCDRDDLSAGRHGFQGIIDEGDLDFAIRCKQELRVWFDGCQKASAVRAGDFLFVAMVFARMDCERGEHGDGEW